MTALEQIRAELDAATPGPWRSFVYQMHRRGPDGDDRVTHISAGTDDNTVAIMDSDFHSVEADATLIAHAPTYLAALLDVAEAAQGLDKECWSLALQEALEALDLLPQQYPKEEQ